nr:hypothetical protein [Tanacetum cinerariifolium]
MLSRISFHVLYGRFIRTTTFFRYAMFIHSCYLCYFIVVISVHCALCSAIFLFMSYTTVIINGDSLVSKPLAVGTVVPPKTEAQKLARKTELKAKSTLLLAIPDEHLLKFHSIKDAKSLWEAIKISFRGNKESKKMHKTIMKQQYEKFIASRSEGLDKTYDRFQKLISQLELNGEVISHEDANIKLLRSLPLAWNNVALIMRNKLEIETLSMDDLYNNLKVYEAEIKGQSSSGSNSHNVAFVSSENTSSINETVNVAHDIHTAGSKEQPSASSYADDVMFSFFTSQSNTPQLDNKDLEHIDTDDLDEMDLKWQVAMITMRGNRSADNERRVVLVETPVSSLVVQDGFGGYDRSYQAEEGPTDFALMTHSSDSTNSSNSETILLGLPEDIYAVVDSCETAQEIWLRERFTSNEGESIESYYHRFLKLMNDLKRNKHFLEKIASNLKFLNNLQPEWSRHVTIVHQTKDLHTADYTQLYDFLKYNQKEVNELKAERITKTQDPLALIANSNNPYAFLAAHQDQSSFNHNYLQQPIQNSEDITDPTTVMNMALALMAKAFKLNYSTPTNNNQRISSNPRNRQIAQPGQNARNLAGYNDVFGNQVIQNAVSNPRVQNVGNQNGLIGVQGNGNQ